MKITDNAQDRNLCNLFLQEARAANFWGNQSLAMRSILCRAGSKQCRQESGRRINFLKIHRHVGHDVAQERVGWRSRVLEHGNPLLV